MDSLSPSMVASPIAMLIYVVHYFETTIFYGDEVAFNRSVLSKTVMSLLLDVDLGNQAIISPICSHIIAFLDESVRGHLGWIV